MNLGYKGVGAALRPHAVDAIRGERRVSKRRPEKGEPKQKHSHLVHYCGYSIAMGIYLALREVPTRRGADMSCKS